MARTAVVAKITAAPGKRDELAAALGELVAATEAEEGTLVYALNLDKANADVIWFYEVYADDAALATHSGSDAMKAVGAKLAGLVGGAPELNVVELVSGKGVPL